METTRGAAVYCRISRDRTGDESGVTRQREDCLALAAKKGWDVAPEHIFIDDDISAFSGKVRPAYRQMMSDVKNGLVGAVLAWHPDRLHRHPRELEDFITAVELAGVPVVTCTAGDYDLSTSDGRLTARITGSVARKESEDKSRRLRRKHQELADLGHWKGGPRPFGYDIARENGRPLQDGRLHIVPAEAEIIEEMVTRVLAGETLYSVAGDLNERGIPTTQDAKWNPNTIKGMILAPRNIGMREHKGQLTVAEWSPVIKDRARWEEVVAILTSRTRKPAAPRQYLLTGGVARCGKCQAWLHAAPKKSGRPGYACRKDKGGCAGVTVSGAALEELVAELLFDRLVNLKPVVVVEDESNAALIGKIEAQLEELVADYYVEKLLDRGSFLAAKGELDKRLEAERNRFSRRTGSTVLAPYVGGDALRSAWGILSFATKRAIVVAVIDHFEVSPATRRGPVFDSNRVRTPAYRL